jgi:hypothetical protein
MGNAHAGGASRTVAAAVFKQARKMNSDNKMNNI